jgi:hypothetical protein
MAPSTSILVVYVGVDPGQMRYSLLTTVKLLVCTHRFERLEIHEWLLTVTGRKYEDKVGLGEPTENPYDGRDRNSCMSHSYSEQSGYF